MLDGYDNRMITAPRFVREGNRLIPESALVRVTVSRASGEKCPRCRRVIAGLDGGALCDRCCAVPGVEAGA